MKISIMYLDRGGGISQCTYELCRILSFLAEATCYLSADNKMLGKFNSLPCRVRTFDWPRGSANLVKAMLAGHDPTGVAEAMEEDNPDIVLDTGSWWWRGVVERKLGGRFPIAEMVHDVTPHPGPMALLYNLHHRLYHSPADIVIGLSDYCYQELMMKYSKKVVFRSKHGILLSNAQIDPDAIAQKRNRMLFFGRIDKYKGIDHLVNAFGVARKSNPDLTLDIVGKGPIDEKTRLRIKELGIGLRNEYVGDDEISEIVRSHGILVLPYTSATQSGVAAIALANGIPCIATRVGALPEQVIDGRNGLIVSPGSPRVLAEAMIRISQDYDLARQMAQEAQRIGAEMYSWDKIGADLIEDLKGFLDGRN